MSWLAERHPVEAAVEWLAPILLAVAVGWASLQLAFSMPIGALLCGAAFIGGRIFLRAMGNARKVSLPAFEPEVFIPQGLDELILDEKDSVLELDDPLDDPKPDSRVVMLFEQPDPTPGELVDRIVGFLADGRQRLPAASPAADTVPQPDASAALHHALANIRASLR